MIWLFSYWSQFSQTRCASAILKDFFGAQTVLAVAELDVVFGPVFPTQARGGFVSRHFYSRQLWLRRAQELRLTLSAAFLVMLLLLLRMTQYCRCHLLLTKSFKQEPVITGWLDWGNESDQLAIVSAVGTPITQRSFTEDVSVFGHFDGGVWVTRVLGGQNAVGAWVA